MIKLAAVTEVKESLQLRISNSLKAYVTFTVQRSEIPSFSILAYYID